MDDFLFLKLITVALLVLANGFFVAAEFAIVKVRETQIEALIKKGSKRAKTTKEIIKQLDAYLSACQLGITFASLALGWIGEPAIAKSLEPVFNTIGIEEPILRHTISLTIAFAIITFLHIVFGELAPKSLAIRKPKQVSMLISVPLNLFYKTFKPFIWFLNTCANLSLKLIGIKPLSESEMAHSEEEIRLLIAEGRKTGIIDATEHEIIQSVFEFNDKLVKEIMVPRNNIVALNINAERDKIFQTATDEGFSRMPVYKDTIDNIVGIVYTKDLIGAAEHREVIAIQDVIRPAYFIPETKKIGQLLRELQKKKLHMAIVVSEYGEIEGLVTMEDILEEIVGEIQDEYDIEQKEVESGVSGEYSLNPAINIRDFNHKFETNIPLDPYYNTLGGFIYKVAGRVPELGEIIKHDNISFTISKKSGNRIIQVKVKFEKLEEK
jgi:CBS domain containing-hemolysin-like protein